MAQRNGTGKQKNSFALKLNWENHHWLHSNCLQSPARVSLALLSLLLSPLVLLCISMQSSHGEGRSARSGTALMIALCLLVMEAEPTAAA